MLSFKEKGVILVVHPSRVEATRGGGWVKIASSDHHTMVLELQACDRATEENRVFLAECRAARGELTIVRRWFKETFGLAAEKDWPLHKLKWLVAYHLLLLGWRQETLTPSERPDGLAPSERRTYGQHLSEFGLQRFSLT